MPVDPVFLSRGQEWRVDGVGGLGSSGPVDPALPGAPESVTPAGGSDFGSMLGEQVGRLGELQDQAAQASQALSSGEATDPTQVVMAVERARLAMQLASQIRTKAVEAYQDVFHTQV